MPLRVKREIPIALVKQEAVRCREVAVNRQPLKRSLSLKLPNPYTVTQPVAVPSLLLSPACLVDSHICVAVASRWFAASL